MLYRSNIFNYNIVKIDKIGKIDKIDKIDNSYWFIHMHVINWELYRSNIFNIFNYNIINID
jgi:hypothetical protein